MGAVIKPVDGQSNVRVLGRAEQARTPVLDPRDAALAALRFELEQVIAERDAARRSAERVEATACEQIAAAVDTARTAALAEGRRAGLAAAEAREQERIAALAGGIADASADFGERLIALDGFAALLARTCLDRIFARPEAMAAMVTDTLRHRMAMLRDDAIVAVRVSAEDFVDTTAIEVAVRAAGARAVIAIDADLPTGACRLSARLAQIELDVPAQWATLARVLDGLADA